MSGRPGVLGRIAVAGLLAALLSTPAGAVGGASLSAGTSGQASAAIDAPSSFADNPRLAAHYRARTALFAGYDPLNGGVAFVGDSITEQGDWASLFPGVSVRNYGISGDRAEGVVARYGQVVASRPGRIILLIGTNNLARGVGPAAVDTDVDTLLGLWKAALPETQLVVQSVLPRQAEYDGPIRELNDRLRRTADRHGADFIDIHTAFVVQGDRLDPTVSNDSLHLTPAGYARWAPLIDACVRTGDCG